MEPETNTLTPDVTEKKRSNVPLYIIFGFLLAAIITLVIIIVVVNINNKQASKIETTPSEDSSNTITNLGGLKRGEEFQNLLSTTTTEAKKLLDEDTVNADKVRELFADAISKYQDPAGAGFAQTLINAEVNLLLDYNLVSDVFNVYNLVEVYIPKDQVIQNELYDKALTLAEKENNQSWIDIFQSKFDATLAAKQDELKAISNANNNYDERIKQMIKEDKEQAQKDASNQDKTMEE
jgi:hypothetical protein